MKKRYKLLIFIITYLILCYLAVLYVNRTFIPVKLKGLLAKNISEYTQRAVDIEKMRFSITKGFVLNGIKIYEGPKENNKFLFRAEKISFGIIFLPSLKKHRLIIPHLALCQPYLNLERSKDGSWNISFLSAKKAEEKKASPFRFTVKSLSFDKGEISFADYCGGRDFQKTITDLRGNAGLSLPNSVSLSFTAKIDSTPIKIISRYKLPKKDLSIELETTDLMLADYWNGYLATFFHADTAAADNQANRLAQLKINSGICEAFLRINVTNFEDTKTRGNIYIQNLEADFNDVTTSGDYKLTGAARFNIKDFTNPQYNLELELEKARVSTPLKSLRNIDDIEGGVSLSEKRWNTKELSCSLYGSPAIVRGGISSPHKDFIIDIELSSTIPLEKIAGIVGIGIESGVATVDTKISYKKDRSYHISGKSQIENLKLRQKNILISGDFSISGESSGIAGNLESLEYKGDMSFTKAKIEGGETFPVVSNLSGEAIFSTKHITIRRLTGIAADTKIALSGDIDYTQKEPLIALGLKADNLSFSNLLSALPEEMRTKFKDIDAKGICSLNLNLSGTAGRPETFRYDGGLSLKNGSLAIPYWPNNLSNIDCDISFNKEGIVWKDLYFDIKDTRYHCYGRAVDLAKPKISLSLKSEDIDLITDVAIEDKTIFVLKSKGKYLGSAFSITGKISDIKTAYADISGNIDFDLGDASHIFGAQQDILGKLKPQGIVKLTFNLQGPLRNAADWNLYVEGGADSIYVWGLRLNDFYIDYRIKDQFIDIPVISAHPYDGIININTRANLKAEDKPYIINIDIKDVDLHQLVGDTEFKNKKIKGTFAAQTVLNGYLGQKDSLKGSGWLQVSDGYLWEFPVMHGILEVIFMLPPEYITLTDAFGNFSVHDKRIYTEDFKILSKTASLLGVGSLGLDGTLDFDITGRFAEDIIKKTTEPGKIASAILQEAGSLIMEVKLTGTLANPKYQIIPFPVKRVLKEKVVDKFKDIFGDIFD